jgi:hypothetical protein
MVGELGDIFIVPEDPLGRDGQTLDQFLNMPSAADTTAVSSADKTAVSSVNKTAVSLVNKTAVSSADKTAAAARHFFKDRLNIFSMSIFNVLGLRFSLNHSVLSSRTIS